MPEYTDNEQEPGVCCACKTSENLRRHFLSETLFFEVCAECKDDGTYLAWLTRELEKADQAEREDTDDLR